MDIMAVRKCRTPYDVASNFDLTFCQVIYNGVDIMATHLEHIHTRKGYLQPDYATLLLEGNKFIKHRCKKYEDRGYQICIADINMTLGTLKKDTPKWTPEKLDMWFQSLMLSTVRNTLNTKYPINPYSIDDEETRKKTLASRFNPINMIELNVKLNFANDDGYESDDYDSPSKIMEFATKNNVTYPMIAQRIEGLEFIKFIMRKDYSMCPAIREYLPIKMKELFDFTQRNQSSLGKYKIDFDSFKAEIKKRKIDCDDEDM